MIRMSLIALCLFVVPAFAGDEPALTGADFMMPSRNVGCVKLDPENGMSDRLYCVRYQPRFIAVVLSQRQMFVSSSYNVIAGLVPAIHVKAGVEIE
jgi:hypothetical protein